MGVLGLFLVIAAALALTGIGFLFGVRSDKAFHITAIVCFAFIITLTMLHISSLPTNYTIRIFVAYLISIVAMVGLAFMRKHPLLIKLALSFALLAHIVGIFMI